MTADADGNKPALPLTRIVGYLTFSNGKPDPRFQAEVNDAYVRCALVNAAAPWETLRQELDDTLDTLAEQPDGPFKDVTQARAVIDLVFDDVVPAYRVHHRDLLHDLADADFFAPFFLVRAFEAVLAHGGPWDEPDRIARQTLMTLNDYVGHRPVAVIENRLKGEVYPHERVRPIPVYIRGAGVAFGPYRDFIGRALEILKDTDAGILADAHFDPALLDELALDPRPYDQGHPAHRRPNYVFGEWDQDHIDQQGRYRRYVVRRIVLDALLERATNESEAAADEMLTESAVALAATILMGAGVRGNGPGAHDSTTTLAALIPQIARYRDAFYAEQMSRTSDAHRQRLQLEAGGAKQPFARSRQYLNEYLATQRARQLQHRHLSQLYAAMGFADASRAEAEKIAVPSVRMLGEIHSRLTTGFLDADRGQLELAAISLIEIEALIRRGIDCGALADPWNILGFQALFPLSPAREDSVRDTRIDDLIMVVEQCFVLYTRLMSEAAATGKRDIVKDIKPAMRQLAEWWDQFASVEVADVRRVNGGEAVSSAKHVADALGKWHKQGKATGDLAFWKQHLESFRSPKAFAVVIDALLEKKDHRAAMALLINWVGQVEQVPLEDGPFSFHALALRWMLTVWNDKQTGDPRLVSKFFDYLEANAGDYWQVPSLEAEQLPMPREQDDEDDLFGAAYEDMSYRDSTDDGTEGTVWDDGEPRKEFTLETEAEPLAKQLRFHSTVAQLWQIAVRTDGATDEATVGAWARLAQHNLRRLFALLDRLQDYAIPEPSGSLDSMMEYDRRRVLKEQLLYTAIGTCLDTALAAGALRGANARLSAHSGTAPAESPPWELLAMLLEAAIWEGDAENVRGRLPAFIEAFRSESLLFKALADGGLPRLIFRARLAQSVLRALVVTLPRLGLLRETHHLLTAAREMEAANRPEGRGVSEFNTIFQMGFVAVAEAVVDASVENDDGQLNAVLEQITARFLNLWAEYSQSLHLSAVEAVRTAKEWEEVRAFVRDYGHDLFHTRFLTLANLRGVLHRGVGAYLDYLTENPDPLHPIRLVDDLERVIPRPKAERLLSIVLNTLVENYEEYKDFNATTAQSDYGENLYMLLDFLRLKAAYDRQAWLFRPLSIAHEVLARQGRVDAALLWEHGFQRVAGQVAERYLQELHRLENQYGVRLRTVADRLDERFVKSLAVDRLCALVGAAMAEARNGQPGSAFTRFREGITDQSATPTGVGLDVPAWLQRLEAEVQRTHAARSAINVLAEQQLRVPKKTLTPDEVARLVQSWDDAAAE